MSKIYLKQLRELAIIYHNRKIARQFLLRDDEEILQNVLKADASYKPSEWGALLPRDITSRWANPSIINWALECIGLYSTVSEIGSCLQMRCAFVDSYVMEEELKSFNSKDGYKPLSIMKKSNLTMLRERLSLCSAETLRDVPGLDFVVFILNSRKDVHWSILVYSVKENILAHFDSMGDVNESLAASAYKMLIALRFIPSGARIRRLANPMLQRGSWECGYVVIATAFHFSDVLRLLVDGVNDPQTLSADNLLLKRLVAAMLERSKLARQLDKLTTRQLERVYEDK
jgi:hypothetical protein